MGLSLMKGMDAVIPNVTKCLTWQDVKASHLAEGNQVVITLDKIYGMMIILALGLIGATLLLTLEFMTKAMKVKMRAASPPEIGKMFCPKA